MDQLLKINLRTASSAVSEEQKSKCSLYSKSTYTLFAKVFDFCIYITRTKTTPQQAGGELSKLKIRKIFTAGICAFLAGCGSVQTVEAPAAKRIPKEIVNHGDKRVDNYFWLREKQNPEVIKHLEAENGYTNAIMKHTETLQDKLYKEMVARINETDTTVPWKNGEYYYYNRTEKGKQYEIYCRKKGSLDAKEEVILDANVVAQGLNYCTVTTLEVTPNQTIAAYGVDTDGDWTAKIYFKNLDTGELYKDTIADVEDFEWGDNKTIFYTVADYAKRSHKIYRHTLGTATKDTLVCHEPDELYNLYIGTTKSKRFIVIVSRSHDTNEVKYLNSSDVYGEFKTVLTRTDKVRYYAHDHGNNFYILTNENAKNNRIVKAPISDPSRKNWVEVIPHNELVKIESMDFFKNHMVLNIREDGLEKIKITDLTTSTSHIVPMPEPIYSFGYWGSDYNRDFNSNKLIYIYTSFLTSNSYYEYDMDTREKTLLKEEQVNNYSRSGYFHERIFAKATDGTMIPISLVYKKGLKKDGSNPLLLTGYGSYGYANDPAFNSNRFSLIERGVVFGIAHIRGGGEYGEKWFEDGKLFKKKNSYTDFIACAEHLIKEGYTNPGKLAITGRSAGGMVMGAVVNMRPDLFRAVIAGVPFVDVLNTMLDESIPLTVTEFELWGNPIKNKEQYDYIKSYSPYDNVTKQNYPNILVHTGYNDSAVCYWEPTKWVAKLREHNTGKTHILLKVNLGAGHTGSSGRYDYLKEVAFEFAFILDQLGIKD